MQKIKIVDGNNWFHRRVSNSMGSPLIECYSEIQTTPGIIIVAWDGIYSRAARQAIYPQYKAQRTTEAEDLRTARNMMKKILELSKATQVELQGIEADDVIAALVMEFKRKKVPADCLFIESNDADLHQLGINMSRDKFPAEPHRITLYKALVGDPSDNISGSRGFGEQAWKNLTEEQKTWLEHIIVNGREYTEEDVRNIVTDFFPPKGLEWFIKNLKVIRDMYRIVNFVPVDIDLVNKNLRPGLNRPDLVEKIKQEYML